jgi:hypothetical protein
MHVVGTYDGSTVRLYIDGTLEDSIPGPSSVAANSLPLGLGAEPSGYRSMNGAIDEAGIYGYALSAAEVDALATP